MDKSSTLVIKIAVRGGYYQGLGHGTNLAAAGCPCVSFLHDVKIYHNLIAAGGGRSEPVDRGWWCADCIAIIGVENGDADAAAKESLSSVEEESN